MLGPGLPIVSAPINSELSAESDSAVSGRPLVTAEYDFDRGRLEGGTASIGGMTCHSPTVESVN